ncbi:prolyl oligopeptidase family serine peptidase [Agrobacterium vitis]|uniref:prolyl oligopeptidase family serine peptidase n=3 Tax=Agrobacterium vitis TaxID=373 RepID=UPI001573CC82|nr:prolyl oligopeptidase family serine peptidase [Agrobacterium vitis]NSZ52364.1 S9 family peptidase [Agrobacterium vitis]NTA31126.1 S9 family peptidase [Agrobacterium vitis]
MDLTLENDSDPQTLAFVADRNAASTAQLSSPQFEADRDAIKAMMERDDRLIIPSRRDKWLFDFHRSKDNPLGIWRRLPADQEAVATAPWETVFDLDAFCAKEDKRWIFSGSVTCPWEPTLVLLCLSDGGSDLTRLLEFDTETKAIVEGGFDTPAVRAHATWLSRDEICYFGSIDTHSATRSGWPRIGRRLRRGQRVEEALPLYEAGESDVTGYSLLIDPQYWKGAADEHPIRLFVAAHEIGRLSAFAEDRHGDLRRLDLPKDISFSINHHHCLWHAKTDERFPAGSLILQGFTPYGHEVLQKPERVLFSPEDGQSIGQFTLLREWAVFIVKNRLQSHLYLLDLKTAESQPFEIALPPEIQSIQYRLLDADLTLGEEILQVIGQGFLKPSTRYLLPLNVADRQPKLQFISEAPAYFDADGMTCELLEAVSEDGTSVPYHIVFPKHWEQGALPALIYGYGGFEVALSPYYSGVNGVWLQQGGAFVQAYIRGGGELGPDWHRVAKGRGRHKAFEDFVAVARDLVKRGYSTPETIACTGGSNGGLLTGVMLTRYPRDFGAVWCRVPVIDMTRFHLFPAGKAWMDEYGDPDKPENRAYLLNYSPLHTIKPASEISYPPIYIESSTNDDRVHPSHARRFALQLESNGHKPLFHEYGSGGHGGSGDTAEQATRTAMGYSFLRQTIVNPSK